MQAPDLNKPEEIKSIYKSCFPQVLNMVIKNSGSADDAHEVFQEAMMVLYNNWRNGNLELTARICTYLQSIAWYKWLNELKRFGKAKNANDEKETVDENTLPYENGIEDRRILLLECISKLGDRCRKIVELFLNGMPGEDIAVQLGYNTYEYYRLAKKRCIDKLKELVKNKTLG
jgi:RNA polymerase sigma factor (sigma-70 family)